MEGTSANVNFTRSTHWRNVAGVVSLADSHVVEPYDLWTRRLAGTRFADRAPQMTGDGESGYRFEIDGLDPFPVGLAGAAGRPSDSLSPQGEMRAGGWETAARLEDMDADVVRAPPPDVRRGARAGARSADPSAFAKGDFVEARHGKDWFAAVVDESVTNHTNEIKSYEILWQSGHRTNAPVANVRERLPRDHLGAQGGAGPILS